MRISITTVRRLQGRQLHPLRSADGVYLFDPREVEAVRSRRPPPPETRNSQDDGELAAEVFKLLRDDVDVRDVVIALRRPAKEIAALYAEWEDIGGAFVISSRVHRQLERMVRHGLLTSEVLEAIEEDSEDLMRNAVSAAVHAKNRSKR